MPIEITKVGGSGPREEDDGGTAVRLRQLSELMLTIRAKFLGFSKMIAGRLGNSRLESAVVNALGELVTLINSYEIRAGDTRLSNPEALLGTDLGIQGHYQEGDIEGWRETDREMTAAAAPPVLVVDAGGKAWSSRFCIALSRDGQRGCYLESGHDGDHEDGDGHKWSDFPSLSTKLASSTLVRAPRERSTDSFPRRVPVLSDLECEFLEWVCISVFADGPERERPGTYAERKVAFERLEQLGYIKSVKTVWKPTPAGFEASGLIGNRKLELDP